MLFANTCLQTYLHAMKKLLLLFASIILLSTTVNANPLDSLKQQLQLTTNDTLKAGIYTQMAYCYLEQSKVPNAYSKRINAENAINYTMLAMHLYSRQNDTTGLVTSYSNLSKAYRTQSKYAQAKWFILQANTLSRRQNSVSNIVNTLVDLAAIKIDIKDYNLAKRDLKEAHRLAKSNHLLAQDSVVKDGYTRLYNFIQVPPAENVFQGLDDNIKKEELAYAAKQKKLAAAMKMAAKKPSAKKKAMIAAVNKTRTEPVKLTAPVVYWETPSNTATPDTIKTAAL
jgi:tetratricopeptide (TPR) repeat protein